MSAAIAGLTKEAFNGKTPTKAHIIEALDTVRELPPGAEAQDRVWPAYEARMAVAGAIGDIFGLFKVLLPATKYRLHIDKLKIEGEYAVLQEKSQRGAVAFLQLRSDNLLSFGESLPPNIISYLRHWHLAQMHGYGDVEAVYLHVPSGGVWRRTLSLPQSQWFARSAAAAYASRTQFPSPGSHCVGCASKACDDLEVAA